MPNYAAGWNMAGYSPDPDSVYITDSFSDAIAYLTDTVERWRDQDYYGEDDAHVIELRYVDAERDFANPGDGPEFSTVVYDANGYGYSFWVQPTDQPLDDES